ncbi:MAG: glucose-6-phosphate isomerase [Erysipelotrichaceae bacterium]
MIKINMDYGYLNNELVNYVDDVKKLHQELHNKTGLGNDFLGWLDWAANYDKEEFAQIQEKAAQIREDADILLVCGIGGSYLGARSAIEMINGLYDDNKVEIIYIGNTFSSTYMMQVLNHLKNKSVYLNVISKSGTTTETSVAFRILQQYMEETYGIKECEKRIVATTDANKGTLKELATKKGYMQFTIPDDIGGRFSVITAVGLLPICVSGIDINEVMRGYQQATKDLNNDDLLKNPAYQYAVIRRIMDKKGYSAEMLVTYEPHLTMIGEWWKQLYGESEGKDGLGLLPTSATFSTDLHSLGQFVQDGKKVLFETILKVKKPMLNMEFPSDEANLDNMNYLAGKDLDYINDKAFEGTLMAHYEDGNVPNIIIELEDNRPFTYGYMIYFFFIACAMTVYLNGSNPFNQPGVEIYKKRMFKLLGKI